MEQKYLYCRTGLVRKACWCKTNIACNEISAEEEEEECCNKGCNSAIPPLLSSAPPRASHYTGPRGHTLIQLHCNNVDHNLAQIDTSSVTEVANAAFHIM